jgi:superfamily II DNA or RNA helicase
MLILVHRDELVFQAAEKLQHLNPNLVVGIEKANYTCAPDCDIIIASVQTLGRKGNYRLKKFLNRIFVVVTDESHHVLGTTYGYILDSFGLGKDETISDELPDGTKRLSVGFTATPNRGDGKGLVKYYSDVTANKNLKWAVENGWLVELVAYTVKSDTDISKIRTIAGDFAKKELATTVNVDRRNSLIVSGYKQHIDGKSAIIFCASVEHAHNLQNAFILSGVSAVAIDGTTDKEIRRSVVEQFKRGEIKILCNYGVFTEGFDAPRCDAIIMARATKSQALYAQMLGRGTRPTVELDYPSIPERLKAISESDKPFLTVLDIVDIVGKHKLVTAVNLVGLKDGFRAEGKKLFKEVIEVIEEKEKQQPDRPFRDADSIEEVETMANEINIWENDVFRIIKNSKDLRELSRYRWMRLGPDSVEITIPDTGEGNIRIRLDRDAMDRYTITKRTSAYKDGQGIWHQPKVHVGIKRAPSLEEGIAAIDTVIATKFSASTWKMEHSPSWGSRTATEPQMNLIRKLGLKLPEGSKITKSEASEIITALKEKPKPNGQARSQPPNRSRARRIVRRPSDTGSSKVSAADAGSKAFTPPRRAG